MGASASSMVIKESPELTAEIKKEYEKLLEDEESLSNEEIESRLRVKFESKLLDVKKVNQELLGNEASKATAINKAVSKTIPSKANTSVKGAPVKSTQTSKTDGKNRRQSFTNEAEKPKLDPKKINTLLNQSSSIDLLPNAVEAAPVLVDICKDTWDSVVEQPSCLICQVNFASELKLDRHVKYSDLHLRTVQKLKEKESQVETDACK